MSMVKERPIIFSDLVWAIMQGKKTQTRRVIKSLDGNDKFECIENGCAYFVNTWLSRPDKPFYVCKKMPYEVGMRLWVRETWLKRPDPDPELGGVEIKYKASDHNIDPALYGGWKSPIYMPRWASRITLEITGVRVERLQEISYTDCCRETGSPLEWEGPGPEPYHRQMHAVFALLWNEINAKRGCPWESNPWVWVLDFKTVNN